MSPELEGTFREDSDGRRAWHGEHQSYVMFLMQMLAEGEPLPNAFEGAGRSWCAMPTWNQGVRCAALDALTSYQRPRLSRI